MRTRARGDRDAVQQDSAELWSSAKINFCLRAFSNALLPIFVQNRSLLFVRRYAAFGPPQHPSI
jgi:hypothetical protein